MGLYLDSWLSEALVVLSLALVTLYAWFSHVFQYWRRKGAPYVEPTFPFGNIYETFVGQKTMAVVLTDLYKKLKGKPYGGIYFFNRPNLLVLEPDLIRTFLVKDFWTFPDRGIPVDHKEPLARHLLFLCGSEWRRLRVKLTPTFTSGKLKMMFQTISDCGREMGEVLEDAAGRADVLEMRELSARYATDIIASVAFGIETNCQRNPDSTFRQWGRRIFETNARAVITSVISFISPKLLTTFRVKSPISGISQYFRDMVRDTIKYREENNVTRKDFMQLLVQLKNKGCVDADSGAAASEAVDTWKLSVDDCAAQAFVFFIAGFETTSTTMSFALHELALSPDVQTRLQEEIDAVLKQHDGQISYDAVNSMRYLDKVVAETLRKYPPLPFLNRVSTAEYQIPESNIILDKGTPILVPVYALHNDPEYFPDPERFDPERFSEEEKAKRHPYVYLPFGEGPRNCIGMRLGLLQTKTGLVHLLSRFSVEPCEKTVVRPEFVPRSVLLRTKTGINLRLRKRS